MPILSASDARKQYESTLNTIANTALFQYTVVAAVHYVALTKSETAYSLLGFKFSREGWGFTAMIGLTAINLYIGRLITYLVSLASLYPRERRVLRYITRHHRWFLNPFRVLVRPRLHKGTRSRGFGTPVPLLSALLYAGVLIATQEPAILLLEGGFSQVNPQLHGFARVVAWVTIPLWFWSGVYVLYRITALGNVLWRGRYSPPD